ncbi:hypothetical protein E2C01_007546 [Portunus trituberculatus]|uniref:Uncharacterized protein n=1 Tax=Portunus trituberculatus TaxID=210409 RepID=A0A5B7D0R3_PORTR|nr:hypothetical protein [Portunus trituberculatus]
MSGSTASNLGRPRLSPFSPLSPRALRSRKVRPLTSVATRGKIRVLSASSEATPITRRNM